MPSRQNDTKNERQDLVDLYFLPKEYLERIEGIFDRYYSLGVNSRNVKSKGDQPVFPSDISTLTSPELGNTLGAYTAWYEYLSDRFKYIVVAHNYMETLLQQELDSELGKLMLDKGHIDAKKAKAKSSEQYIVLMSYKTNLSGLKIMLSEQLSTYDRSIGSISREISRREHNGGY